MYAHNITWLQSSSLESSNEFAYQGYCLMSIQPSFRVGGIDEDL